MYSSYVFITAFELYNLLVSFWSYFNKFHTLFATFSLSVNVLFLFDVDVVVDVVVVVALLTSFVSLNRFCCFYFSTLFYYNSEVDCPYEYDN